MSNRRAIQDEALKRMTHILEERLQQHVQETHVYDGSTNVWEGSEENEEYAADLERLIELVQDSILHPEDTFEFWPGDRVKKKEGYEWPGFVVCSFRNLEGRARYVVECTVPGVKGALHIYSGHQLEKVDEPAGERVQP